MLNTGGLHFPIRCLSGTTPPPLFIAKNRVSESLRGCYALCKDESSKKCHAIDILTLHSHSPQQHHHCSPLSPLFACTVFTELNKMHASGHISLSDLVLGLSANLEKLEQCEARHVSLHEIAALVKHADVIPAPEYRSLVNRGLALLPKTSKAELFGKKLRSLTFFLVRDRLVTVWLSPSDGVPAGKGTSNVYT